MSTTGKEFKATLGIQSSSLELFNKRPISSEMQATGSCSASHNSPSQRMKTLYILYM